VWLGEPDDGDALALTIAQPVEPAEVEEPDEEEEFGSYSGSSNSGGCDERHLAEIMAVPRTRRPYGTYS
jgi:hypothetical protein